MTSIIVLFDSSRLVRDDVKVVEVKQAIRCIQLSTAYHLHCCVKWLLCFRTDTLVKTRQTSRLAKAS